jgi:hypothetical protein
MLRRVHWLLLTFRSIVDPILLLLLLLLLLLFTATEFSLGGSIPYTSTDKTNKNETIQKYSTNNRKHTYNQNTHTVFKSPHTLKKNTLQNKLKQPQYKIHTKWNSHHAVKYPQYKVTLK